VGGFLVWGDPSLYESTLAIAQTIVADAANDGDASEGSGIGSRSGTDGDGVRPDEPERVRTPLGAAPIGLRVIPGISCVLALAARHQIPLNRQGKAVQISPARLLAEGMPADVDDVVCMLDGKQTFSLIDPAGIDIYWGAYLGTPDEILICGALSEVSEEILAVRAEAVRRKGWMFDTYLLRRR
jgi:precorrin-6A synthase